MVGPSGPTSPLYPDRKSLSVVAARIVYHLVVCPLHEGRVDITERDQSSLAIPAEKVTACPSAIPTSNALSGNRLIMYVMSNLLASRSHPTIRLSSSAISTRVSKHILVKLRLIRFIFHDPLSGIFIEQSRCMPYGGRFLGRFVPFALHRFNMK